MNKYIKQVAKGAKEHIMSIFDDSIANLGNNTPSIDWSPTVGKWHESRIVGICDLGDQKSTWKGETKLQRKLSLMLVVDETITFDDGKVINKTRCERFTASMAENSGIMKRILGNLSNVKVEKLRDMIGLNLRIKLKKEGDYTNLALVDDPETPLALPEGLYVPKWWIENKDGTATNYPIAVEEGVKAELIAKAEVNPETTPESDTLPF